ncbi:glycosyltransferase involved in cell wall biosynthesis [Litoreibacter meonggei]|uniref:Glycosyltransferase involved in cell wall biosynthesis n=1 Tax=Litoreibacter meonggei TaxID=1049199 RepID=A0A497VHQ4_9RHOB|nr:glycosyltransferase family 2 protein [Litoreibacter meonggei]RLJ36213.1 glycosyltransferase involved in cell wall biosynthesis [Litoreibacter meonggei]
MTDRRYLLISPCRNEATYMRQTLDTVVAQTVTPAKWVIVDDGSTDETPAILAEYAARHDWIEVIAKPDRGHRAVGPGVVEAFYFGLDRVDMGAFPYLCKLDLDLALPERYFEELMDRMEADPRIGTCSGKPYIRQNGALISERRGDEMSVGMTKFYRTGCFQQIGGFVHEVMWDALDCHKARQLGWRAVSWDTPDLRFEHLRPMGSSQTSIHTGRRRHGFGQYYMGSDPLFFAATCIFRMAEPPYILGGFSMMQGYLGAWIRGVPRHEDAELRAFIRTYQRRALRVGKARAVAEIESERAGLLTTSGSEATS